MLTRAHAVVRFRGTRSHRSRYARGLWEARHSLAIGFTEKGACSRLRVVFASTARNPRGADAYARDVLGHARDEPSRFVRPSSRFDVFDLFIDRLGDRWPLIINDVQCPTVGRDHLVRSDTERKPCLYTVLVVFNNNA